MPSQFDWRDHGIMSPVKNQRDCGFCGEFAAMAVFEALIKKETGAEVDLSEQQMISCVPGCGCESGCSSLRVLNYIRHNGIVLETDFPWKVKDSECGTKRLGRHFLTEVHQTIIDGRPLPDRIRMIKEAIRQYGPVATNLRLYDDLGQNQSGVYTYNGKAEEIGGHWVVLVGWKDDDDQPGGGYWICRNSWGGKFGCEGYYFSFYGDKSGIDDYYIVYGVYSPAE